MYCIRMRVRALHQHCSQFLCCKASARVMSRKVGWYSSKMILEPQARGSQTTPKCPGTNCSGWTGEQGGQGSPAEWVSRCQAALTHTLCLYVHLHPSLELSVIHKSDFISPCIQHIYSTLMQQAHCCNIKRYTCLAIHWML